MTWFFSCPKFNIRDPPFIHFETRYPRPDLFSYPKSEIQDPIFLQTQKYPTFSLSKNWEPESDLFFRHFSRSGPDQNQSGFSGFLIFPDFPDILWPRPWFKFETLTFPFFRDFGHFRLRIMTSLRYMATISSGSTFTFQFRPVQNFRCSTFSPAFNIKNAIRSHGCCSVYCLATSFSCRCTLCTNIFGAKFLFFF